MADYNDEDDKPVTNLHPAVEAAATGSRKRSVQMWSANAASMIQDHLAERQVAANAMQEHNAFVQGMAGTRDNLVGMVKSDPTAAPLAFTLADSLHEAIGASHPDPDQGPALAEQMAGHFRSEIAKAAVQGWAAKDADMARTVLDRYRDHMDPADLAGLDQYITGLDTLRTADAQAAKITQAHNAVQASNQGTANYMAALAHPETGAVAFPPGWGQTMMQDEKLAPDAKAALFRGYSQLQQNGEPMASNPSTVMELLDRASLPYNHPDHPLTPEVALHLGTNLTTSDAQYLASKLGPQSAATRQETEALSNALGDAEDMIGNRNAFARFVPAFLKAAQGGGLNLDPASKDYSFAPERMSRWMPTGDDVVAPAQEAYLLNITSDQQPQRPTSDQQPQRPALAQIFSGGWTREPYSSDVSSGPNGPRPGDVPGIEIRNLNNPQGVAVRSLAPNGKTLDDMPSGGGNNNGMDTPFPENPQHSQMY